MITSLGYSQLMSTVESFNFMRTHKAARTITCVEASNCAYTLQYYSEQPQRPLLYLAYPYRLTSVTVVRYDRMCGDD